MADIRQVSGQFAVSPQIEAADFPEIFAMGYRTVINNRPEGESAGQMPGIEAEAAAKAAGLTYVHAPFAGPPTNDAIVALSQALAQDMGPVLAYCRSGTRSITAWAMVQAQSGAMDADSIVEKARSAGYDLSPMRGSLRKNR